MELREAVAEARRILADVTPLKTDCGRACGGACCQPDEDGQGGMLLFPGEEALYEALPDGFSIREDDAVLPDMKLLICDGVCERENRPLSCRLFPLLPLPGENGSIRVVTDRRARAVCPLARQGKTAMDPAFIEAVREAGELLAEDPDQEYFLSLLADEQEELKKLAQLLGGGNGNG